MVKRIVLAGFLAVSCANAGMFDSVAGAVMGGGSSSAASVSESDIKGVISSFQDAEKALSSSIELINKALGDKQAIAKLEEEKKTILAMPDGAEKDAKMKELEKSAEAEAAKILKSKEAANKAAKLSSEQKQKIAVAGYNILLAALKDKDALAKAKNLVSSVSANPTMAVKFAGDLPKLKDIVATAPSQIESLATISSGFMSLAKTAKISVTQPASSNEPFKPVDNI